MPAMKTAENSNSKIICKHPWDRYDPARRYRRMIMFSEDNAENLPADYIPALESRYANNINMLKAHLYGHFCHLSGKAACPDFHYDRNTIKCELDPFTPIIFSLDFNVDPLAWVAMQESSIELQFARKKICVVVAEGSGNASLVTDATVEFMHKVPSSLFYRTPILIDGDSQGHRRNPLAAGTPFSVIKQILVTEFKSVQVVANQFNPLEADSIEAMNQAFSDEWLYLSRTCTNSIMSCQASTLIEGKRALSKPAGEKVTHWFDSMKYPVFRLRESNRIDKTPKPRVLY